MIEQPEYTKEEEMLDVHHQPKFPILLDKKYTDCFYGRRRNNFLCFISRDFNFKNKPVTFKGWFVRAMIDSIDDTQWTADMECSTFEEAKEKLKIARRFLSVLPRKGISLEYFREYFEKQNGFEIDLW